MPQALVKLGSAAAVVAALLIGVNQVVRVSAPDAFESEGIVFNYLRTGQTSALAPWTLGLTLVVWAALVRLGRKTEGAPTRGVSPEPPRERYASVLVPTPPTLDSAPVWLADKAEDAAAMMRVLVETFGSRIRRRARPGGVVDRQWQMFRESGTVGGCVALALRLHVDVPKPMRTPAELIMRASLVLEVPDASLAYDDCSTFLRESLLSVERQGRARAVPVLLATWVYGVVGGEQAIHDNPEAIAELAMLYESETSGYWTSAELE